MAIPQARKTVTIHFLYEDPVGPIKSEGLRNKELDKYPDGFKRFAVACHPTALLPKHATGDPRAANCEKCKATQVYQKAMAEFSKPEDDLVEAPESEFPAGKKPVRAEVAAKNNTPSKQ